MKDSATIAKPESEELTPVILHPSPALLVSTWVVAAIALCGGISTLKQHPLMGICITTVMGLAVCAMPFVLSSRWRPQLSITRDGMSFGNTRHAALFIPWQDVTGVRVGWLGVDAVDIKWNRWVFVDYRRNGRMTSCSIFPHFYGLDAGRLATLLTRYSARAQPK